MYYCYILRNNHPDYKNYTYVGCTNNPLHRLRQHNQEISGGAKYTSSKGNLWEIIVLIEGFPDYQNALRCEWRLKHPDNKIKKSSKYSKIHGRFRALNEVLCLEKWTSKCTEKNSNYSYKVYVKKEYESLVDTSLGEHFTLIAFENLDEYMNKITIQ